MDCSLPGSSVHGFSRQEYWSGLPFPSPGYCPNPGIEPASPALAGGFSTVYVTMEAHLSAQFSSVAQSCPTLCDPMDYSLSGSSVHGFSRQEYWRGLSVPSPGHIPNPGIKPVSLMSRALADRFFHPCAAYSRYLIFYRVRLL